MLAAVVLTPLHIATFFIPGVGSCGDKKPENDLIVALPSKLMKNSNEYLHFVLYALVTPSRSLSMCGRKIVVKAPNGKQVTAEVGDTCSHCASDNIELSPAAFEVFASPDADHIQNIIWKLE